MNIFPKPAIRSCRRRLSAFTLVEMLISTGIYLFIFVGVMVAVQIFGLRVYTLSAAKLTATSGSRKVMDQLRDDIRMANTLQVGTLGTAGMPATFAAVSGTNGAKGNALQIFATTNTTAYSIYYLDTSTSTNYLKLYVLTNGVATTDVLARYITNSVIFDAEDFQGNIISNNLQNNQVYGVTLQFYQWEYPVANPGGNGRDVYNFYQLRTKVCRRALN